MSYLVPLIAGFVFSTLSAFTAFYSRLFGERGGRAVTSVMRNAVGIPLWLWGFVLAWLKPSPLYFIPMRWMRIAGVVIVIIGCVPIVWGHLSLGLRSHMPSIKDTLVRSGLYAYVRHPIYAGLIASFAGLSIYNPAASFVRACTIGAVWALIQARLEEFDLKTRMPGYEEYMREVPRFTPFKKSVSFRR